MTSPKDPPSRRGPRPDNNEEDALLSLTEAANLLGVHPSTLRLWSDKGMLPVVRTPGGHRRYRRKDLVLWSGTRQKPRQVEPQKMIEEVVRGVRAQISEGRLSQEPWFQKLDEEARRQYRDSARSLFQGLLTYLADDTEQSIRESFAIGYEYASRARRYRLSYVEAVKAFLFFRDTLIESVITVYSRVRAPATQLASIFHRIHTFTDAILISLLETYQKLEDANR